MKWKHCRKGLIEGKVVMDDGEFVSIRLENFVQGFNSEWHKGEVITVKKSFLTEIPK